MISNILPSTRKNTKPKWSDDQVRALLEFDADDPQTWSKAMHKWLRKSNKCTPYADGFANRTLEEKRMDVLHEAVYQRCRVVLAYETLLIAALWERIPYDSLEYDLLCKLDEVSTELERQLVDVTADLLPKLEKAWPNVTIEQVLEAMGEPRPERRETS